MIYCAHNGTVPVKSSKTRTCCAISHYNPLTFIIETEVKIVFLFLMFPRPCFFPVPLGFKIYRLWLNLLSLPRNDYFCRLFYKPHGSRTSPDQEESKPIRWNQHGFGRYDRLGDFYRERRHSQKSGLTWLADNGLGNNRGTYAHWRRLLR
jgi:hypothetical protein